LNEDVRIEISGGGYPTAEEAAALVAAVELLVKGGPSLPVGPEGPAASEWALQGRMSDLHWAPLNQRWPGEAPGRSWRRVLS